MATETVGKAAGKVKDTAKGTAKTAKGAAAGADLTSSLRRLAETVTSRAANTLTDKVTSTTGRLTEYTSGEGKGGLLKAFTGGDSGDKSVADHAKSGAKSGAVKGAISGAFKGLKEKIKNVFSGGGKGKIKVTNIIEQIDVGVPVDLAYDQWTRFTEFPSFMKKVESVGQVSDEKLEWKAKIFWSQRTWEATILEQVPDERIIWRSKGNKGHVDGAVTFHELAPDLTRILVVLEYHPKGLFEKTGNLWRAQGRRVRLELKHFRRHVMSHALLHPDEIEGWRGEIRDGEVVESPEDASEDGTRDDAPDDSDDHSEDAPEDVTDEDGADEADEEADEEAPEEDSDEDEPKANSRRE